MDHFFSSLNFRHSSFITQNTLPVWHHHSLVNIFHVVCGPHTYHLVQLFSFSFSFFLSITKPSEKKKRKKIPRSDHRTQWKKKKKKRKRKKETQIKRKKKKPPSVKGKRKRKWRWRNARIEPSEERKKKWSKVAAKVWQWILPCSVIYGNAIKLWFMETKNIWNVFSVSITHNSKIKELSDGNRVMVVPNGLLAIDPTIFELWVMETENWVMEKSHPNTS